MQAFWSDDNKVIVLVGFKTGKKYDVEYENLTYEKTQKVTVNNCGYLQVDGTEDEPVPINKEIQVGAVKMNLSGVKQWSSKERPYCTKKETDEDEGKSKATTTGEYSMNNAPTPPQSFTCKGDLYIYGFKPKEKIQVTWQVTGNKSRTLKAREGGIIVLKTSESYPLTPETRITVEGINIQPLHEDAI